MLWMRIKLLVLSVVNFISFYTIGRHADWRYNIVYKKHNLSRRIETLRDKRTSRRYIVGLDDDLPF